jgi:hypothetical protein
MPLIWTSAAVRPFWLLAKGALDCPAFDKESRVIAAGVATAEGSAVKSFLRCSIRGQPHRGPAKNRLASGGSAMLSTASPASPILFSSPEPELCSPVCGLSSCR